MVNTPGNTQGGTNSEAGEVEARVPGREPVRFETGDGLSLEGARFGRGPVWVVLGHMRPADMTSWFPFAQLVADAGHTALAYNNRGYGASAGVATEYRVGADALAAIAFARAHGARQVFYIGASMNGTAALFVGAREDLAGIAALSGVPEFSGTDGLTSVPDIAAPKLFVAARDDGAKADNARQFYDAAGDPRDLILYEQGGHGTDMFTANGPALTARLLEFIAANL